MIRIAVVEDDAESSDKIIKFIRRYQTENEEDNFIVDLFTNGVDFLSDVKEDTDVVFMDIEMPLMNGLDAAKKLRDKNFDCCLIFTTNMAQYAVKGYEVDALDFMVKPISYFNFSMKLKKAIRIMKSRQAESIQISFGNGQKRVFVPDIKYIEVIKHKTYIHTKDGVFEQRISLNEMEKKLERFSFAKCNKCYLVNLRYVSSIDGNICTAGGEILQISRSQKKSFVDALTNYLNGGIVL